MNRRTHSREHGSLLSLCVFLAVAGLSIGPALAVPPTCTQDPIFAGDLGDAPPNDPPPQTSQGYFASDINLDGDGSLAIVGEIFGGLDNGHGPGFARMYTLTGGAWKQTDWLQHEDALDGDSFGSSVDLSGDFAIITAPTRQNASSVPVGAVYFFEKVGSDWQQHTELFNPDGDQDAGFGGSFTRHETCAIHDRLAVVAASSADVTYQSQTLQSAGKVYVYLYDYLADQWELEATLTAPTPTADQHFGYSVDLRGTKIIVGAPAITASPSVPGKAYIFKRTLPGGVPTWVLDGSALVGDNSNGDDFGWSVSIDGDYAAVGEPSVGKGHTFVFKYNATTGQWDEQADLTPSTSATSQAFGYNVCISSTQLLAGANAYNGSGTAYLWTRSGTTWSETRQLTSSTASNGDRIGETLALERNNAFVGALGEDDPNLEGGQHGAILIFTNVATCN